MNNKRLGSAFEKKVCCELYENGYWVHFIEPNSSGAQPFDVIAMRKNIVLAIDCKTLNENSRSFPINRIEDNQWLAFEQMKKKTNAIIGIVCENNGKIYFILYDELKASYRSVRLNEQMNYRWEEVLK